MNKELIKKYKVEFDYWINGGNIQAYYKLDNTPKWWTDKESLDYYGDDNFNNVIENSLDTDDVLVVIDDEYIEFRRALAEGKTIQLNEATMTYLLLQLRQFLQVRIDVHTASNKESYTLEMPEVSRFNWKDKYDSYIKDNLLNSKMLAQVISGRRQSDIMAAYFFEEACFGGSEEDGQSSASSSSSSDSSSDGSNDDSGSDTSATSGSDTGEVGRPELPDDQKSEKTLQNRESL